VVNVQTKAFWMKYGTPSVNGKPVHLERVAVGRPEAARRARPVAGGWRLLDLHMR
jgi:hypothetical protein